MTTIIGVQYDGFCELVADSLVSNDSGRTWIHPDMTKINRRGVFLIAGAGEVAACDIAQHIWDPPVPNEKDKRDLYHFMITKVIPSLRDSFKSNGYILDKSDDEETTSRFQFIVAVNGELFDIGDDLSVMRSADGFYAIGSGADIALGALHAGAEAQEAVEIACKISAYSSLPLQVEIQHSY